MRPPRVPAATAEHQCLPIGDDPGKLEFARAGTPPGRDKNFIGYPFKITTYGDLAKATVPTVKFQIRVSDDAFMKRE